MEDEREFTVIEWHMLKKYKFYPLAGLGSFTVQLVLHPIGLIRTRLVMQHKNELYQGMIHGARSILAKEGFSGLYNGFYVKSVQLLSGIPYVATYEGVRFNLGSKFGLSDGLRSFIAGGCASAVGQTLIVPVDVVSQHLMILNNIDKSVGSLSSVRLSFEELKSSRSRFFGIIRNIFRNYGIFGFYKGYLISMFTFVPNSALWWMFYNEYCGLITRFYYSYFPKIYDKIPRLATQVVAAPFAGATAAIIMNPVDCVRMRMQVKQNSFVEAIKILWEEEGIRVYKKGLTARIFQSAVYSFWIMFTYEQIKYFSLKDEFKNHIKY